MSYELSSIAESRAGQWLLMERLRREQEHTTDTRPYDHERSTITISREYGAGGHDHFILRAGDFGYYGMADAFSEGSPRNDPADYDLLWTGRPAKPGLRPQSLFANAVVQQR